MEPAKASAHFMRSALLCLINRIRAHDGLSSLRLNADLAKAAGQHSNEMVARHFFSHEGANGSTPTTRIRRTGYLSRASRYQIGENIGAGEGQRLGSPWAVYRSWMGSPPHRANILSPGFDEVGVGVARGFPFVRSHDAATYTLDLAARH